MFCSLHFQLASVAFYLVMTQVQNSTLGGGLTIWIIRAKDLLNYRQNTFLRVLDEYDKRDCSKTERCSLSQQWWKLVLDGDDVNNGIRVRLFFPSWTALLVRLYIVLWCIRTLYSFHHNSCGMPSPRVWLVFLNVEKVFFPFLYFKKLLQRLYMQRGCEDDYHHLFGSGLLVRIFSTMLVWLLQYMTHILYRYIFLSNDMIFLTNKSVLFSIKYL